MLVTFIVLGHTKILEEFKRCQDTNFAVTFHMQKLPSAYSSTGGGGVYSNSNSGNVSHSPYLHATLSHCSNTVGSPDQQNAETFAQGWQDKSFINFENDSNNMFFIKYKPQKYLKIISRGFYSEKGRLLVSYSHLSSYYVLLSKFESLKKTFDDPV